jgi:hypothetical protein
MKSHSLLDKNYLRKAAIGSLALLLCSCAATSVKKTWKSPDYHGGPFTKIAALVIDERTLLRQGFENRFVSQLKEQGATAVTTHDLLSLSEIEHDKPGAGERFRAAGADALLILRLVNVGARYREVRSGDERYVGYVTGFEPGVWYNYYSVAYMNMMPTYGALKQYVLLETSLYDLKTAQRVWSGVTETTVKENMDRVAEMNPLVAKILAIMRKDGVIP